MRNFHFKILFLVLFTAIILTGCTTTKQDKTTLTENSLSSSSIQVSSTTDVLTYSLTQVSEHNTEVDCWQVINGKVYNISKYIPNHPGGLNSVLKGCGKDATKMFDLQHKPKTKEMLKNYYLGNLE
ncbi:MAG: cytochrome b5-like heme/steroid binding domain-containing protein [Patescibacteria group bacterium]|jgi:cytochrome b involved in lipid metabolism|nr:cytochrome b5-like heme/steroid binding domain-containing protein [Patescibacteria group bacterium]